MYNVLYGSQSYVVDNPIAAAVLRFASQVLKDGSPEVSNDLRTFAMRIETGYVVIPTQGLQELAIAAPFKEGARLAMVEVSNAA